MSDRDPADDAAALHRRVRSGAIAVAVVLVASFALTMGRDVVDPPSAVGASSNAALTPSSRLFIGSSRSASTAATAPALANAAAADVGDKAARGTVEVCGVGRLPLERADVLDDAHATRAGTAIQNVIASLRSDADERHRVSGLYLQGAREVAATAAAQRTATARRCGDNAACIEEAAPGAAAAMARAAQQSAEQIAQLASTSREPFTYAVALEACGRAELTVEAPSCRLLSFEQWARIDPGNATPWLHAAVAASARKDSAALDEAMYRIGMATGNRIYGDALFGYAMAHVPSDADDFERAQVFFAAVAVPGSWQLPAYKTVIDYCAAAAVRDSNRWQTCDAVARQLVERPATVLDRRIGRRIGERVGWPADRLATLRDEDDAMYRVANQVLTDPEPLSCKGVERMRGYWLQVARLGEPGAGLALLAASGQNVAAVAAEARADQARASALSAQARASEAAAQPASAASRADS